MTPLELEAADDKFPAEQLPQTCSGTEVLWDLSVFGPLLGRYSSWTWDLSVS
jgi:hypothetical protein